MMWRHLILALLCGWATCALAAEAKTVAGTEPTEADVSVYPWSSIAKLNNSVGGSCTASLIEQDQVLTAAHCLFNRRTNRFLPPAAIHVLFGYKRGHYVAHALVGSYILGPGYDPARELSTVSSDWAILKLVDPVPNQIRPLRFVDRVPAPGFELNLGSYGQRRLYLMTADRNCELLGQVPGTALFAHNCSAAPGSSGAPLLFVEDGAAFIIGMQVAIERRDGTDVRLAISAPSIAAARPQ